MEFSEDVVERIKTCLNDKKGNIVCIKLGIYEPDDSLEEKINCVEEYIAKYLNGDIRGNIAIDRFFKTMEKYTSTDEIARINEPEAIYHEFIDYKSVLPIKSKIKSDKIKGFRTCGKYLGQDLKEYLVKEAEGLKGNVSGLGTSKQAKFNPTIVYSIFKYLGEDCAGAIPSFDSFPYFYIFSENFLKDNQELVSIEDITEGNEEIEFNDNGGLKHSKIINIFEEYINTKNFDDETKKKIFEKIKLQYAVQETLKKLVFSMDENLGNTSVIETKDGNGKIVDINISPAYDLDLSLNLGEDMMNKLNTAHIFFRTTEDGKNDLKSLIQEFKSIPGYSNKVQEFVGKLNGNYLDEIFDIAYEHTGIEKFRKEEFKKNYSSFIMRRVALFKEACREEKDRSENEL